MRSAAAFLKWDLVPDVLRSNPHSRLQYCWWLKSIFYSTEDPTVSHTSSRSWWLDANVCSLISPNWNWNDWWSLWQQKRREHLQCDPCVCFHGYGERMARDPAASGLSCRSYLLSPLLHDQGSLSSSWRTLFSLVLQNILTTDSQHFAASHDVHAVWINTCHNHIPSSNRQSERNYFRECLEQRSTVFICGLFSSLSPTRRLFLLVSGWVITETGVEGFLGPMQTAGKM